MNEFWIRIKTNFSVVGLLIVINVLAFIITQYYTFKFNGYSQVALVFLGGEFFPLVIDGEVWRMILSSFLHGSFFHLIINMWALWNIGGLVERFYGGKKTFLIYIITGITGSLLSLGITAISYFSGGTADSSFAVSIGASGAIFGLIGLILGTKYKDDLYSNSVYLYVNTSQLWLFVGYNVLIGLGINLLGTSININNWAHIGGLVGGIMLKVLLEPINTYNKSRNKKYIEEGVFWMCIFAFLTSIVLHTASIML